jgi:hypothetical protein
MTPAEQSAFVKAYGKNVAHHSKSDVADFVARYELEENFEYSCEQASIMDALCMWHDAIKWKLSGTSA